MNTYVTQAWSSTMRLVTADPTVLPKAAADFETLLAGVDRVASRFRPDSALSRANRNAGRPTPVPALLVDLVATALQGARESDGAVDPTLGRALRQVGYDRDIELVRAGDRPADGGRAAGPVPHRAIRPVDPATGGGWRRVRLDRELGLLTVPAGCELDLGATAKAHIADYAAHALATRYDTSVLVELGGDVAAAGVRAGGWIIQVAEHEGGAGQKVQLKYGGLATSTTTVRRWQQDGAAQHHILDPDTGRPVEGPWRTVTVAAPCALAANVASTAALVMGEQAVSWLEQRGLPARLVGTDGAVLVTGSWPAPAGTAVA